MQQEDITHFYLFIRKIKQLNVQYFNALVDCVGMGFIWSLRGQC